MRIHISAATTCSIIASAIVILAIILLRHYHIDFPADFATALGTLMTIGSHFLVALKNHLKETKMSDVQNLTQTVETAVNALVPAAAAVAEAIDPAAAPLVATATGALQAAESTTNAVESSLASGAAPVAAAAAGAQALASAPVVTSNPTVAAHISVLSSFIQWLEGTVGKL